jgi:hypothetical protein
MLVNGTPMALSTAWLTTTEEKCRIREELKTVAERKRRKVLIVSFHFPPTNTVAAVRLGKFAKYLPQFRWEPVVLTAAELKAYSQNLPVEVEEANIFRTRYFALGPTVSYGLTGGQRTVYQAPPKIPTWRKVLYRLLRLMEPVYTLPLIRTMTLEPVGWYRPAVKKGLEIIEKEEIAVIFSSFNPSVSHFVAARLHKQTGVPWVAEFRDLWSLNHYVKKVQPFHFFERRLEKKVMKHSALLITVSEPWAKELETLHSRKVVTISNGFDEEDYSDNVPLTTKFTITYTGNIYPGRQDPSPLFEAIAQLRAKGKISSDNFGVRFLGGATVTSLSPAIKSYRLEGIVKICGLVPFNESIRKQKESTVLLLLGWNDPREKGVYTAKLFEYLGARRPVLGIGLKGDVADELLKNSGAGVLLDQADAIEALLSEWLKEFEQSGTITSHYEPNEAVIRQYTRKQQAGKLAQLLEEASGC